MPIAKIKGKPQTYSSTAQTQPAFHSQGETALFVEKATKLSGTVVAPPSKSYTHRAIIIGSMNGLSRVINPLISDDTTATIEAWQQLGASISKDDTVDKLTLIIQGFEGKPKPVASQIDVGEAGTLLRFILPVLGLVDKDVTLVGNKTLVARPNDMMVGPLKTLGIDIEAQDDENYVLPITVRGKGRIRGGTVAVEGKTSSQAVSALLMVAPFADDKMVVHVDGQLVSKPYVDITIDVLNHAGIKVTKEGQDFVVNKGQVYRPLNNFVIHGDYSSSAFLMAAACLVDSDVTIQDLVEDKQGDREIINILKQMGANIIHTGNSVRIRGPANLRAIELCGTDIPDLIPPIAAVAVFAEGRSRIYGIQHLRYKESNRLFSLAAELSKINVKITATNDELIINGLPSLRVDSPSLLSYSDHRIAMALAIIGLRARSLSIAGTECISKSYPNFIRDMKHIGASLEMR